MKAVCEKYGALLILDETMSGMGRTGTLHVWQSPLIDVIPDLQTIGKGLGGGYAPVAALLANRRVIEAMQKGTGSFSHGQTYQGHPIACATALEVVRTMKEEKLVENSMAKGELLGTLLKEQVLPLPFVGDVRGKGLFWGVSQSLPTLRTRRLTRRRLSLSKTRPQRSLLIPARALLWVCMTQVSNQPQRSSLPRLIYLRHARALQPFHLSRNRNGRRSKG